MIRLTQIDTRVALMAGVAAVALATVAAPAAAQQTERQEETALDEIVVTGSFATSLADALVIKRRADSISDVVSASDIGNFPAVNVAEALQRVPGVSISREAGEGQFVSVRGLGPNFQSVTLNGSPIAYNENIRNSDQSGRQFQFRVIPADLISAIVVTKAPTADLLDGGIGANIDIRTADALDTEPFATARLYTHYETRTEKNTPNGSLSAGWRNADRTFGIIAGVSLATRDVQFDRVQTTGYTNRLVNGVTVAVPNEIQLTLEREERARVSAMAGLSWRPTDALAARMDVLYSRFNNTIDEDRISFGLGGRADFSTRLVASSARVVNGILYAGQINGGRIDRNAEYSEQQHENISIRGQVDWDVAGWTLTPSISYSEAKSFLPVPLQRISGATAENPAGLTYSYDFGDDPVGNREYASLLTNLDLGSPTSTTVSAYRTRPINSEDNDTTALLNVGRDFDADLGAITLSSIAFGGQYTDRSRDYQRRDRVLTARPGANVNTPEYLNQQLPTNAFDQAIRNLYNMGLTYNRALFGISYVIPNEANDTNAQSEDLVATGADLQQSYGVDEEITAFYGRADFSADLGSMPLEANLGLRWVSTETLVKGTLLTAGRNSAGAVTTVVNPQTFEGSYEEFLPSLNINLNLRDNLMLRVGASRTLTRPSLADLRTAVVPNSSLITQVFLNGQTALDAATASAKVGVGGNPELSPYTSVNYDASLEWYFNDFGALYGAVFKKDISDFIGGIARTEQILFATQAGQTLTADLLITRPQNIGDATVEGIEFGGSYRMDWGFGLAASATFTDSEAEIEATPGTLTTAGLQGVSDTSYSISPFFERGPFEIHFSYTYRSDFTANGNITPGSNAVIDKNAAIVADGFGTLDFGASWQVNDTFQIFAEGTNIADERQAVYQGNEDRPFQVQEYGPSYNLGLRATF
ncbi:TonB-dependent receptor [Brevundimonas subvibrioides]|uniref:TonB-dependent receptor n=1 Tax=Brevundimonas subvibrioides (strain ATCC 15264 / DSM 4735 / LMG 14903 / NBRC 16000 / CB 81) TaxID=633149 RepID=D9QLX7_BRESC|nr:TonB-dependent receptor [Brevundimonas subvibrioides]ADL00061.1 TonB-dependent receptor [Brevundimonas subvibrioides ATCC 15264]